MRLFCGHKLHRPAPQDCFPKGVLWGVLGGFFVVVLIIFVLQKFQDFLVQLSWLLKYFNTRVQSFQSRVEGIKFVIVYC